MSTLEKWEVEPLDSHLRGRILRLLGLSGFEFSYEERMGGLPLRRWNVMGEKVAAYFTDEDPQTGAAFIRRELPATAFSEKPLFPATTLSEELLPFPFQLWLQPTSAEASGTLTSGPPEWSQAAARLGEVFVGLEKRLQSAEITILELGEAEQSLVLFFHCVRKRFLKLGVLTGVTAGTLEASDLDNQGASYQILAIAPSDHGSFAEQVDAIAQGALAPARIALPVPAGASLIGPSAGLPL